MEYIALERLKPRHDQPRSIFEQKSLEELAQSIINHGIIQPLVVSPAENNIYSIIVGERRWRAAKIAKLQNLPCIIRDIQDHTQLEIAIIENIQREAMTPLEEARAYKRLIEEYDYTHEFIAKKIGKSRSVITNLLRILELPETMIDSLRECRITYAHARSLCGVDDSIKRHAIYTKIIEKKLSVRDTETLIRSVSKSNRKKQKKHIKSIVNIADMTYITEMLKDKYGTNVRIKGNGQSGTIEFAYYSQDDLSRFIDIALKNELDNP